MTYCLGIITKFGLIMASDSRTNAGYDQINVCQKMHTFVKPGERAFILLSSGSLSLTQSILTLLQRDFDQGQGLALAPTMYDAARVIGERIRCVADMDRAALERDHFQFNVHFLLGGQIKGEPPALMLIYPQGNPLQASAESPFLQIGETKYGRPILDRGIRFDKTPLEEAAKYALLSLDSTMKSNVTVGPPIDMVAYDADSLKITHRRRFLADDPDLSKIRTRWEQALRQSIQRLPNVRFRVAPESSPGEEQSIQLIDSGNNDVPAEQVTQKQPREPSASSQQ